VAVGSYYRRILGRAYSGANKKCAPHWWWKVIVGGPGGVAILAALRLYRGESAVLELSPDPFIAAIGGASLVWLGTFAYQLVLAPAELDATKNEDIGKLEREKGERDSRIATLEKSQSDPAPAPVEQRRRDEVQSLFANCSDEVAEILNRLLNGTLQMNYIRGGSSKTLPGAADFFRIYQANEDRVVLGRTEAGRSPFYELSPGYRSAVEGFLNDRLGLAAINSSINQT
jgi:hypothetical protein